MAKRFRLRISWVIPSFRSCRSKADAASPLFRVSPGNPMARHPHAPPPPGKLHVEPSSRRPQVPVVPSSGCRCGPVRSGRPGWCSDAEADGLCTAMEAPPACLWRKEGKWHVVACVDCSPRRKIDAHDVGRELFPPLPIRRRRRRVATEKKKKRGPTAKPRARVSTSSADSHYCFSSEYETEYVEDYDDDDDDETEPLVSSSRSFSIECCSPQLNPRLKPIREYPDHRQKVAPAPAAPERPFPPRECGDSVRRVLCPSPASSSPSARGSDSPASSTAPRRVTVTPLRGVAAEGKVGESFAVVKRSEDPYGDFRRSMEEMVVANEMYEERDLEQLLQCFLSLNSCHHHPAIALAFSDVWATLFPSFEAATPPPPPPSASP